MIRNQFTFYRSFYESLDPLSPLERSHIILAICAYALYEEEPSGLTGTESACFNLVRPILDAGRKKAAAGAKGGEANRKQGETESKPEAFPKQGESESKDKYKDKVKDKDKYKDKNKDKDNSHYPPLPPSEEPPVIYSPVMEVWTDILLLYPEDHVGNRRGAEEAYRKCVRSPEDARQMLRSLKAWKQSEQWTKAGGQYIPQLVNWISRGTWTIAPAKMATPKGASGNLGLAEMEAIWQQLPPEDAARARQEYMKAGGDL